GTLQGDHARLQVLANAGRSLAADVDRVGHHGHGRRHAASRRHATAARAGAGDSAARYRTIGVERLARPVPAPPRALASRVALRAPFVLALELGSQGTIATLAACQIFQHASKVALFGLRGFNITRYLAPSALLCACSILGSAIGTRLLDQIPQKHFKISIKLV